MLQPSPAPLDLEAFTSGGNTPPCGGLVGVSFCITGLSPASAVIISGFDALYEVRSPARRRLWDLCPSLSSPLIAIP